MQQGCRNPLEQGLQDMFLIDSVIRVMYLEI